MALPSVIRWRYRLCGRLRESRLFLNLSLNLGSPRNEIQIHGRGVAKRSDHLTFIATSIMQHSGSLLLVVALESFAAGQMLAMSPRRCRRELQC